MPSSTTSQDELGLWNTRYRSAVPPARSADTAAPWLSSIEDRDGASSSTIVPAPVPSPIAALLAPESVSANCSSASTAASPSTFTGTVAVVAPAERVKVPEAVVKSVPDVAEPPDVA